MTPTVAALFVDPLGVYARRLLDDSIDPWPEHRDARLYAGPAPVVAHPPCNRWSILATVRHQRDGQDGGCFAAALAAVRAYGGVLEHPRYSMAWPAFGLRRPAGSWIPAGDGIGWTCMVEQGHYGHSMAKPTWLYAAGVRLPQLRWGRSPKPRDTQNMSSRGSGRASSIRRSATPPAFAALLLSMARSVPPHA